MTVWKNSFGKKNSDRKITKKKKNFKSLKLLNGDDAIKLLYPNNFVYNVKLIKNEF